MSKIQKEVAAVQEKNENLTSTVNEMDKGLRFMNSEVEVLKVEKEKHCNEIERLKEKIRDMEVYQRRENLRFHGIPEAAEEDTQEVTLQDRESARHRVPAHTQSWKKESRPEWGYHRKIPPFSGPRTSIH